MSEALGCPSPERALVETDRCRMFAETFEPHGVLVLVATKDLSAVDFQHASLDIRARLSAAPGSPQRTKPAAPAQPQTTHLFHDR